VASSSNGSTPPGGASLNGHSTNGAGDLLAEQARLEGEIAKARVRLAAARQLTAQREAESNAVMRAELEASRALLAEMEQRTASQVAQVRAAADDEIARVRGGDHGD